MLPFLMVLGVAVGVAYPFLWGKRGFLKKRTDADVTVADAMTAAEGAVTPTTPRVSTREELCPQCSRLNPPGRKTCIECSGPMPVEDISSLWEGAQKEELIREGIQSGILFVAMLIAMALAYNLPLMGKLVILIITIAALSWRFLRAISD
jgi:hypothetical protein